MADDGVTLFSKLIDSKQKWAEDGRLLTGKTALILRRGRASQMTKPLPQLQRQKRCACGQPAVTVKTIRRYRTQGRLEPLWAAHFVPRLDMRPPEPLCVQAALTQTAVSGRGGKRSHCRCRTPKPAVRDSSPLLLKFEIAVETLDGHPSRRSPTHLRDKPVF
jgi:hypothetical protein